MQVLFCALGDVMYLGAEADAHLFVSWHPMLCGAPLKATKTKISDKPGAGESMAPIIVARPVGTPARPGAKKQNRSVSDKKTLTAVGLEALARVSGGSKAKSATRLHSKSQVCPARAARLLQHAHLPPAKLIIKRGATAH